MLWCRLGLGYVRTGLLSRAFVPKRDRSAVAEHATTIEHYTNPKATLSAPAAHATALHISFASEL